MHSETSTEPNSVVNDRRPVAQQTIFRYIPVYSLRVSIFHPWMTRPCSSGGGSIRSF